MNTYEELKLLEESLETCPTETQEILRDQIYETALRKYVQLNRMINRSIKDPILKRLVPSMKKNIRTMEELMNKYQTPDKTSI